MNQEEHCTNNPQWRNWGPYLAERQWGTVRKDYSDNGDEWNYTPYETSHSKAYPYKNGRRPLYGEIEKAGQAARTDDHILFYEYFDGDTGRGYGAAHQTGWTGLIASIIDMKYSGNFS